ncbi:MAG: hypothetical protein SGJ27_08750 [Candidatus Melainabacteria bacterium]|nr:hypothetical protein [Candidatus Melainabacteria bacterium]
MKDNSAVIIIDTGFSLESLRQAGKILAVINVATGRVETGSPYLTWSENADVLSVFAHDPLNHGSLVLKSLTALAPDLPVVLVRGYGYDQKMARTEFKHGRQVRAGWTEAYLAAVGVCRERGLASVANLSFGGYHHAVDGTGWESHCLAQVTGAGKSGHVVVAGAGAGDGSALHASWRVETGGMEVAIASQSGSTTYNFWSAAQTGSPHANDWLLEVLLNGKLVAQELSGHIWPNLWNNRKQVTVRVEGVGQVRIRTSRFWSGDTEHGGSLLTGDTSGSRGLLSPGLGACDSDAGDSRQALRGILASPGKSHSLMGATDSATTPESLPVAELLDPLRFDCWISQTDSDAVFLTHRDVKSIAEPAIFPHVIAVGLESGSYAADQNQPGSKPDLLLPGGGPISFRLPEVVVKVARMLATNPSLDVVAVRERLQADKVA